MTFGDVGVAGGGRERGEGGVAGEMNFGEDQGWHFSFQKIALFGG